MRRRIFEQQWEERAEWAEKVGVFWLTESLRWKQRIDSGLDRSCSAFNKQGVAESV
jgi:hypothetical protein